MDMRLKRVSAAKLELQKNMNKMLFFLCIPGFQTITHKDTDFRAYTTRIMQDCVQKKIIT